MAQWIISIIAILTVIYNTIVTQITLKNEVRHLVKDVDEIRRGVKRIEQWFIDQAKK